MGLFASLGKLFGASDSEGSSSSRREVRIEGRQSDRHTHNDGKTGTDTYAAKVAYDNGKVVSDKDAGFGHISNNDDGTKTGHLK